MQAFKMSFHGCVELLSLMSSQSDINEDLINAELAKNLPLNTDKMGDLPMWDPHVKAFLLLQTYFSRIDLPIPDHVGD